MEVEAQQTDPVQVRNLMFVGTTGSGKSSSANWIIGQGEGQPFPVGHDIESCTFCAGEFIYQRSPTEKDRLIDTPGFNDNTMGEAQVNAVIRDISLLLVDPTVKSTGRLDALILVVKFTPTPSMLKSDLEHIIDLFGTAALKSTILLPIYVCNEGAATAPPKTDQEFLQVLNTMPEIVNIMKQGKNEEPNENWFCLWDNKNPREGQKEKLFEKISKLEPYTHQKFIEADQEMKQKIATKANEEVQKQMQKVNEDIATDQAARDQRIKQLQEDSNRQSKELAEARDRASKMTWDIRNTMIQNRKGHESEIQKLYEQMRADKAKRDQQHAEAVKKVKEEHEQERKQLMEQHNADMANMQTQLNNMQAQQNDDSSDDDDFICNLI